LEELESLHLIEGYLEQPTGTPSISRRQMIKTASVVGGFAIGSMFPLVRSIVAPTPAMAAPVSNRDPMPPMPTIRKRCTQTCDVGEPSEKTYTWVCAESQLCTGDCVTRQFTCR
ncbi:MAG: hypothetical protein AB4063_25250, partial [Crocosphaera sp.]